MKISIDSFKDFLVDQARQFQNTPNIRIDSFRLFWTYIHPWKRVSRLTEQKRGKHQWEREQQNVTKVIGAKRNAGSEGLGSKLLVRSSLHQRSKARRFNLAFGHSEIF